MSLFPRRAPAAFDGDAEFVDSMRQHGATSPATALRDRDLPRVSQERFRDLLDRGILREGAPGTFYLYDHAVPPSTATVRSSAFPARALLKSVLFWLVVILIPVIIIQFSQ
jgi:hypothetical protein